MQYACSQKGEYSNVLTARFKDYQSTLLAQAERQMATILITLDSIRLVLSLGIFYKKFTPSIISYNIFRIVNI